MNRTCERRTCCRSIAVLFAIILLNAALFAQVDEAKKAIEQGEFVRAITILNEQIATQPSADAYLYLGIAYGNVKEYQKAEETLQAGSNRYPGDTRFHTELAG